jgi:hypothetical protein
MSYKLVEKIIDSESLAKEIGAVGKQILVVFARFANDDGTCAYPSKSTVARKAGCSRNCVYQHIDRFAKLSLLIDTGEKHPFPHGRFTTTYSINVKLIDTVFNDDSVLQDDCHRRIQPVSSSMTTSVIPVHATLSYNSVPLSQTKEAPKVSGQGKAFEVDDE